MPLSKEEVIQKVNSAPYWYHNIRLYEDFATPGNMPAAGYHVQRYGVPENLEGLRVLDVGAWDGYWTFEALARGAKEVVAIDDFSDHVGEIKLQDRQGWHNFELCKEVLGYSDDRCKHIEMSLYDLTEENLGRFDIVMFFGVLYHLRYPLLALDTLSAICDEAIFVESAVCDFFSPYKRGGYSGNQMVMEFYPGNQLAHNETNWWAPTYAVMCHMLEAAGFQNIVGYYLTDNPGDNPAQARAFARGYKPGSKLDGLPAFNRAQGSQFDKK